MVAYYIPVEGRDGTLNVYSCMNEVRLWSALVMGYPMNLMNGWRYCVRLILSQNTVCDRESITHEISMGWAGYRLLSLNGRMGCIEYTVPCSSQRSK